MLEKLKAGTSLVIDRYVYSGVAYTSAKVRAPSPLRARPWRAGLSSALDPDARRASTLPGARRPTPGFPCPTCSFTSS